MSRTTSLTVLCPDSGSQERRRAWALIPIKDRARCKTRLAAALSPAARLDLVRSMLGAVLAAACSARSIQRVIVISPERDRVPEHIPVLADTGHSLNGALTQAHSLLRELGRFDVAVLPADLPNISADEIDALVQAARSGGFAIAPDATGAGTNALCLGQAVPFRFQFGPHSREAHLKEARRLGLDAQVIHRPGLAFDVDSPADLDTLEARSWDTHLRA